MGKIRCARTVAIVVGMFVVMSMLASSAEAAPPANDNYVNATPFGAVPGTVTGNNLEATRQGGEPDNGQNTVWWKWTATETGRFRLDTCLTVPAFDSILGVYIGPNAANLTEIADENVNDCSSGNLSALAFDAIAGVEYRFSVGTGFFEDSQNIRLSLRRTPPNDNFAAAADFDVAEGFSKGSNLEATREVGEPDNGQNTVWWKWTAPATGLYILDTCDTLPAYDSELGVYTGTAVAQLLQTAIPDGTQTCSESGNLSALQFNATQGQEYRFSVGTGFFEDSGNIVLTLTSQACIDAKKVARKAKKKAEKAQSQFDNAKKKVKKAKSQRQKRNAKAALKSAKKKRKEANAAEQAALANRAALC